MCVVFEWYGVVVLLCWSCVLDHVLCSSRCVSSVIPWVFDVCPPDMCLVCVYEGGDFFV